MKNNKPQTIRESIDAYRKRMSQEGFLENSQRNQWYFPYDNHQFAMKAGSDEIKRIFEKSGKFKFTKEVTDSGCYVYNWDCLSTDTRILADCVDKGGLDRGCYCESHNLGKGWIPMSIHPDKYGNDVYLGAIETLEALLSLAEEYKIPMVTQHRNAEMGHPFVRYDPK